MLILLDIIAPVFGVVFIGYVAARLGWLSKTSAEGIGAFVFNFAIPAMLFRAMATRAMPEAIDWSFLIAYFGGAYLAWALGMVISRQGFRRDFAEAAVAGMGGAFGNTVMLGVPLVLMTYGEAGMLPAFLIISFHFWQLLPAHWFLRKLRRYFVERHFLLQELLIHLLGLRQHLC